jgi:hypothetical protein
MQKSLSCLQITAVLTYFLDCSALLVDMGYRLSNILLGAFQLLSGRLVLLIDSACLARGLAALMIAVSAVITDRVLSRLDETQRQHFQELAAA